MPAVHGHRSTCLGYAAASSLAMQCGVLLWARHISPSSYAHICTVRYCSTMSHLTILVWPGQACQRLARLPASARTQEIFLDSDGASQRNPPRGARRDPEGHPKRGHRETPPVGQVVLTGQTDRPEWILRWLEPPDKRPVRPTPGP